MIRDLRFSDVPRQLLPGGLDGEDWAYTRAALSADPRQRSQLALLRWSVVSTKSQCAVACVEHGRLAAVALLHTRRGMRAWEVAHLFTAPEGLPFVSELLDRCVNAVAQRGGECLFLRVQYRGRMQDAARRAGFLPAYTEELFLLRRAMRAEVQAPALALRPLMQSDTHGLFRLYNAAVPVNARAVLGLTLDQWVDAREELGAPAREYVWEQEDRTRAWLRLAQRGKALEVDALLHPDYGSQARSLTTAAAQLSRAHSIAAWTVPSYQPALSLTLQRGGWELGQTYTVLARSAASRVQEPALMPVQA